MADPGLFDEFVAAGERIAEHYEQREFSRAVREIMALADRANQYIDERKPWVLAKEADREWSCRTSARQASTCSGC